VPVNTLAFASTGNNPSSVGLCGNGNAMLATGATFVANTAEALGCAGGSSLTFAGGTLLINGTALSSSLPITLGTGGGTIDTTATTRRSPA